MTTVDFTNQDTILESLYVMADEIAAGTRCQKCGRPKATPDDLARWVAECGTDYRGMDPEWARECGEQVHCWSINTRHCHNRIARDLRYVARRDEFAEYCKEHGL